MTRVLFLGIDAMDRELVDRFSGDLPHVSALQRQGTAMRVRSTFPPDSDTAWATISTGLSPAQHGVVRFVDPLEKTYQILNVGSLNEPLQGKTFWELVGQAGYKAYALFPHLCYPIWDVPATMVARGSAVAGVAATPPEVLDGYPNPEVLLGVRGFPDRTPAAMREYARKLKALALADAEFGLRVMQQYEWDLFFIYWSTIDATGHFFWNYFDPTDPGYEAGNQFESVIPETYKTYDEIVGRFLEAVDDDVTVIALSDHGHGGRPFQLVSVNEVLRKGGVLSVRNLKANPHLNLFEKAKRTAIRTVSRYGLARIAGRTMRHFPRVVQTFTRPSSVNWNKTVAYASDMSGIKSYTYGGIMINRGALDGRDYETVRSEIIDLMERECVLPGGESLIQFIARREDIDSGPYIARYPDIVLEFKYGYGVGWAVGGPLITQAASYNLVPGSHRGENGICIIRGAGDIGVDTIDLLDVTPTILDLMSVPHDMQEYPGKSILSARQSSDRSQDPTVISRT